MLDSISSSTDEVVSRSVGRGANVDGESTILKYEAKAEPGGKIAQLGSRLIMSTAKKLSTKFFKNFEDYMNGDLEIPLEEN